jgi:hypothetical protein
VTRYFMTIPEAVQLVLQSASLPECAGRIALLEMGTQMKIVDLAEQLIRLSGLVPGKDVQIVFTGLRPGEKIEEELLAPGEMALTTTIDKIRVVEPGAIDGALLAQRLRHLLHLMARHDEPALVRALATLVPDHLLVGREASLMVANGNGKHAAGNGNGRQMAAANGNGNGNGHSNGSGNGNARKPARPLSIRDARTQIMPAQTRRKGTT